jgi:hypothetical protein
MDCALILLGFGRSTPLFRGMRMGVDLGLQNRCSTTELNWLTNLFTATYACQPCASQTPALTPPARSVIDVASYRKRR